MTQALLMLICMSAVLHINFDHLKRTYLCYLFKPLTTSLILLLAVYQTSDFTTFQYLIFTGLIFSLFGDVFLMLKSDKFIHGLASFLIAHICYIAAFSQTVGFYSNALLLIILSLYSLVLLWVLMPHLGKLKWAVVAYAISLFLMVLTSFSWYHLSWLPFASLAFIGAIFFMLSDSVLAFNRFVKPFKLAQPIILVTYYMAQTLIALSLTDF